MAALEFQIEVLRGAIENLPREEREIIKGIYIENKSRRELSLRLFISENTLHRRRRKAVEALANMISIIF